MYYGFVHLLHVHSLVHGYIQATDDCFQHMFVHVHKMNNIMWPRA